MIGAEHRDGRATTRSPASATTPHGAFRIDGARRRCRAPRRPDASCSRAATAVQRRRRCARVDGGWARRRRPDGGRAGRRSPSRPASTRRCCAGSCPRTDEIPFDAAAPLHGDAASQPRRPGASSTSRARRSGSSRMCDQRAHGRRRPRRSTARTGMARRSTSSAARGAAGAGVRDRSRCRATSATRASPTSSSGLTLLGLVGLDRSAARGGRRARSPNAARPASG